jgi:predicted ATPase/DNA-binding CsgD family transcriptional regulator
MSELHHRVSLRSMTGATRGRRAGNLPAELTSFVGRRRELTQVRRLLETARMVTLTGPGGVGKTRLALRAAQQAQRAFQHGTWLVELAHIGEPGLLAQSVGTVLGVREQTLRTPLEAVCELLRDRELLLVLDNCEHLEDACAELTASVLRSCPGVRVMTTSRHRLGVDGEHTFRVPPLALPEPDPAKLPGPQALLAFEAVALFSERAAAAAPGFAVNSGNAAEVAALCTRLDGIPLALELAAVRLRSLTPAQVLARLDDRFRLLTTGSRTAQPRQQTLRAMIDWSFGLCSPAERALWTRLSVFAGECDLNAVLEVCTAEGVEPEQVLDLLAALVDKSVLTCEHRSGGARYRMLETMRSYGEEQLLDSGEATACRRRHRDHYRRIAEQAGRHWLTPSQGEWLDRLRLEHANLRAALEFCAVQPGEAAAGLVFAAGLGTYWEGSGSVSEGRRWLDRLLAAVPAPRATATPTPNQPQPNQPQPRPKPAPARGRGPTRRSARADGLSTAGWLAVIQSDTKAAEVFLTEARQLGEQLGDESTLAYVTLYRGMAALATGALRPAAELFEEALAVHRRIGNTYAIAIALVRLALVSFAVGDYPRAVEWAEECRVFCEARGERWSRAYALWVLGLERWWAGDDAAATALQRESVRANHDFDDRLGMALGLEALAWFAATGARHPRAAVLLGAADAVWQATGAPLSGFGLLADYRRRYTETTRKALGAREFGRAFREGSALSMDQAVAFALADGTAAKRPSAAGAAAGPAASAAPGRPVLTRRESEVAAMVARGRTNKEIAAELVIAQRTAETHVENILAKLGFTSRAQIAAWASER